MLKVFGVRYVLGIGARRDDPETDRQDDLRDKSNDGDLTAIAAGHEIRQTLGHMPPGRDVVEQLTAAERCWLEPVMPSMKDGDRDMEDGSGPVSLVKQLVC